MNEQALKHRILEISKERNVNFQTVLTKLAEERFLARVSMSTVKKHLILKGGNLLYNQLNTQRKTVDIDFSLKNIKSDPALITELIEKIVKIDLDDGFMFSNVVGERLDHHRMEEPGMRFKITYSIGKMKNKIQVDLAIGDIIEPISIKYHPMKYKGNSIYPGEITLLAYSLEFQCAEKLQIIMGLGEATSRMRDFYDVLIIFRSQKLHEKKFKKILEEVFKKRYTELKESISYSSEGFENMQNAWTSFHRKQKLSNFDLNFKEVISEINSYLKKVI